jgi:hypothetical protein
MGSSLLPLTGVQPPWLSVFTDSNPEALWHVVLLQLFC